MSLSKDDVRHIAGLAKLRFADSELDDFASKLGDIVQFVDQLQNTEMEGVEPMAHPLDKVQRLRPDAVTEIVDRVKFQQNAAEVSDGLYLVPRVID